MQHEEIDHHGPEHEIIEAVRMDIEPLLRDLHETLHDYQVMAAGKQWTIEMNTSCGFKARLIVQVDNLGSCQNEATNGQAT